MVSRFIAGLICAASLTAGEGAFAQEFRIFDHDHGTAGAQAQEASAARAAYVRKEVHLRFAR